MARYQPPVVVTCDLCGKTIEGDDGISSNRYDLTMHGVEGKTVKADVFLGPKLPDLHATCFYAGVADGALWAAPRTRAAKPDAPPEATQPAPDAPKKSRKGAAKNEQAD